MLLNFEVTKFDCIFCFSSTKQKSQIERRRWASWSQEEAGVLYPTEVAFRTNSPPWAWRPLRARRAVAPLRQAAAATAQGIHQKTTLWTLHSQERWTVGLQPTGKLDFILQEGVANGFWRETTWFLFKSSDFSPRLFFGDFQYEFDAFGRHFHLLLKHDPAASSATQTLRAHHVFSNHSHVQPVHQDASRCFYSGTVRDDDKSKVNLNLCHGMVSTKPLVCLFWVGKSFHTTRRPAPFYFLYSRALLFSWPKRVVIYSVHSSVYESRLQFARAESLKSVRLGRKNIKLLTSWLKAEPVEL